MTSILQRTVLVAALATAIPVAHSAAPVDVDRVVACASERDDARRLACYDAAVAGPKHPTQAPKEPKPTATEFGVTGSAVARQRSQEQEQNQDEKVESLAAAVVKVSSQPRGELVVTLDNGQVWMQKKIERYFTVKPGDKVTINAGVLGSFRMINGNRSTQVTRVK